MPHPHSRGGSRNSLRGGGGSGPEFFEGGGARVQVRGNFHILTSKKQTNKNSEGGGGLNPLPPPPPSGSATALFLVPKKIEIVSGTILCAEAGTLGHATYRLSSPTRKFGQLHNIYLTRK